jgi:hypothetical protein
VNLIGQAHNLFTDLLRLPLIFKLFILYGAAAAAWQWWKERRQAGVIAASAAWPVYRARVVWAQVSDQRRDGRHGPSYWEALLTYSYTVPGHDLEVGEYRQQFEDESEAEDWARALRDTFADVRVDPANGKHSVWQQTPILTSPYQMAPELDGSRLQRTEPWGIREILAAIVFCAAALGALCAAWIQISCLTGNPLLTAEANQTEFFGMHLGAILCGIAASLLAQRGNWQRVTFQRSFKASTTGTGIKVLGAYTTVVFLYGWVRMAAHDGDSSFLGVLMFSAVWLIIYTGAAVTSLHAMRQAGAN